MRIQEKIQMDIHGLEEHGPITVVALGDSVTHGAVASGEVDYETVYWNRLRRKIQALNPDVPVNVINAGIGGTTAQRSVARLDSQVLNHRPDLVIVCFGLNDVNGPLEDYLEALRTIFFRCREVRRISYLEYERLRLFFLLFRFFRQDAIAPQFHQNLTDAFCLLMVYCS